MSCTLILDGIGTLKCHVLPLSNHVLITVSIENEAGWSWMELDEGSTYTYVIGLRAEALSVVKTKKKFGIACPGPVHPLFSQLVASVILKRSVNFGCGAGLD